MGNPSLIRRQYATPMSTRPAAVNTMESGSLRTNCFSFCRAELMRSMSLTRRSVIQLKSIITTKITPKHARVSINASVEKKNEKCWTVVANMRAVTKSRTCETSTPRAMPTPNETAATSSVSSARTTFTCPVRIPNTW